MPGCCVFGCTSGYSTNKEKVRLISFPNPKTSVKTHQAWIESVNRANFKVNATTKVCEKHFKATDFIPREQNVDKRGRPKTLPTLRPTAVPSLYMRGGAPQKSPEKIPKLAPIRNDHTYGQPSSAEAIVVQSNEVPVDMEVEVTAGTKNSLVLVTSLLRLCEVGSCCTLPQSPLAQSFF